MSKSNSYIWPDNVFFETEADKDFAKIGKEDIKCFIDNDINSIF